MNSDTFLRAVLEIERVWLIGSVAVVVGVTTVLLIGAVLSGNLTSALGLVVPTALGVIVLGSILYLEFRVWDSD